MIFTTKQDTVKDIWAKAKKHSGASIVGLPYDMENYQLCECCDQPILKEPISLWEHTKEFQVFGFGYPLWFSFLKYCIFLVVILIASRTGSQIYMATKQNYDFCYGNNKNGHDNSTKAQSSHHPKAHQQSDHFQMVSLRHSDVNRQFIMYAHNSHSPVTELASKSTKQGSKSTQQGFKPTKQGSKSTKEESNTVSQHPHDDEQQCTSFMIYLSMIRGQPMYKDEFLKIINFLIHLMALVGIRNMIQKEQQYYDQRTCSLSDYSIMITDLPPVYGTKQMVVNMFKEEFQKTYGSSSSQVKEIIYVMQSEKIQQYKNDVKGLEKQALEAIEHDEFRKLENIKAKIHDLDNEFDRQVQKLSGDMRRDYIKCDKMIVIMNTQTNKGEVLEKYEQGLQNGKNFYKYFYHPANSNKQVQIKMKEAPEPNEIIWQHIDESDKQRKLLILRGWAFTFVFLAAITVIFYFILLVKTNIFLKAVEMQHHDPNSQAAKHFKFIATIIVFIALFGVILFNKFVMGKVLHIFVHMERHGYTDKQNHSFAIKYALGMFFTTALMTLAVEAITFQNFYTHQYGVIEQETIMFFVTAFFIPLVWLIHPYDLMKKFSFIGKQNQLMPQKQANYLIEHFAYDSGKRYAQIFEIMWFTFLYSELIPFGSFLILIGLVLYYWVDKYNFLRRSALKQGISGKLAILGLKSLDATLFLSYAGQILFDQIIRHQHSILPIILTVLGLVYLFIPISDIIWKINGQKFLLQSKTYDQAKYSFKDHYITLHPVYKLTHKKQIIEYKKKVAEYYREEFKKIKMYGAGRGNFMKDEMQQNQHIRHVNSLPEDNSDPNSILHKKMTI